MTLFFSQGMPSITTIIPAMDHIDEHLTTAAIDNKYPLVIKVALVIGKKTLNRYYDKTDHSEVFRIAIDMYFPLSLFFFLSMASITPSSQASILQKCGMAG